MSAGVSVVIPCFNYGKFLGAAIDSVLAQTHAAREIIIVDDGSTDASAEVARGYGAPVTLISRPNGGISAARNTGIREASAELLGFLDADDLWTSDKLERQVEALSRDPGAGLRVRARATVHSVRSCRRRCATPLPVLPIRCRHGWHRRC